jgi:hypothetical protein
VAVPDEHGGWGLTAEPALLFGLALVAVALAGWTWLVPIAVAAPLVAVELSYDMRSRSRRLVPELCGAVGVAAVAASVALAGGATTRLALALWLVLGGRVLAAVPFVRVQIRRLRHPSVSFVSSDVAQFVGVAVAASAAAIDPSVTAGSIAVTVLAIAQLVGVRRPAVPAKTLGVRQLLSGLAVVGITAVGIWA